MLVFGLATSVFDFGTDFNFAWSVPRDCENTTANGSQPFDKIFVSSPCGLLYYKNVERLSYTYIAYPGLFLAFNAVHLLVKWQFQDGKTICQRLTKAFLVVLEVSLVVGLLVAAMWSNVWENQLPRLALFYDLTIQGMAYISALLVFGIKALGVFSHGPKTKNLVQLATKDETIFEAATQLALMMRILMSSGVRSEAGSLSALSSILVIMKVVLLHHHHHVYDQDHNSD